MKKGLIALSSVISTLAMTSLASAQDYVGPVIDSFKENIGSKIMTAIASSQTGFIKFLFFILVFLVISAIVSMIPLFKEKKGISILVSIVISILSVYFIPSELITLMVNPYSALGAAILSVIPFAIMVLFTQYMLTNRFLKEIAWLFFAVLMVALMIYTQIETRQGPSWLGWLYGLTSVAAVFMLFFGKKLDKYIWRGKLEALEEGVDKKIQKRLALDRLATASDKAKVDALDAVEE